MNSIIQILASAVISLPLIVVAIVGLVLIRTRLKPFYPRAHFFSALGLGILLAYGLLVAVTRAYLAGSFGPVARGVDLANKITMYNIASFALLSVALVLIVVALFADRNPGNAPPATAQGGS